MGHSIEVEVPITDFKPALIACLLMPAATGHCQTKADATARTLAESLLKADTVYSHPSVKS